MKHEEVLAELTAGDCEVVASEQYSALFELASQPEHIDDFLRLVLAFQSQSNQESVVALVRRAVEGLDTLEVGRSSSLDDILPQMSEFSYVIVEGLTKTIAVSSNAKREFKVDGNSLASWLCISETNQAAILEPSGPLIKTVPARSIALGYDIEVTCLRLGESLGKLSRYLLILNDSQPSTDLAWLADSFKLTPAEIDIAKLFYVGNSLEEISERRGRSVATVKTQFYTLLEKCGCKSQICFLRLLTTDSKLKTISPLALNRLRKTERRQFLLARPGGRTIDVVGIGDPEGDVVVSINTFMARQPPPLFERYLTENGIYFCSIAPPGSGQTSPAPKNQSDAQCLANDIESFLQCIECDRVVLFGTSVAFPISLQIAQLKPNLIGAVFTNTAIAPAGRCSRSKKSHYWLTRMRLLMGSKHGSTHIWVFQAFVKYLRKTGIQRFLENALRHSPECLKVCLRPDVLIEVEEAFDRSFMQGSRSNANLFQQSVFSNWEKEIPACPVPIYLAIGELDSVGPYESLKELSEEYPENIEFEGVRGVTSVYPYSKPEVFIDLMQKAIDVGYSRILP